MTELSQTHGIGFGGMGGIRKWALLSERLLVSDPAEIAARMAQRPEQVGHQMGWGLVMSAYAEKDASGAWNFALAMKPGRDRQSALMSVISVYAERDPRQAIQLLDAIDDEQLKRQVRSTVIMTMARNDPQGALEMATKVDDLRPDDFSVSTIFHQWVRVNPEAAKAAALGLTGPAADQARNALLNGLAQNDPEAAWRYALTLPDTAENHQDPRQMVIQNWAQSDPQAALNAALQLKDPSGRALAVNAAVSSWARSDPTAALRYAIGVEDPTARADILRTISMNPTGNRQDLFNAVLESMPAGDNFRQAVSGILSNWARDNPSEAAAAVMQLAPSSVFSQAASQVASEWARTGKKEDVLEWVRQLPEGEGRRSAYASLFSQWSGQDPIKALAALNALPPADRKGAAQSFSAGWSRKDPEAVLRWSASLQDANERRDVIRAAVQQWANTSPEAAAKYVQTLAESERGSAVQAVVDRWASKNAEAAAAWLSGQPAGASKDSALAALTRKIAVEDPETAIAWASTISDSKARSRQLENLARDWMRQDATAARQWISTSDLPAKTRARLMK